MQKPLEIVPAKKAEFVRTDVSKALPPNPALLCGGPDLGDCCP